LPFGTLTAVLLLVASSPQTPTPLVGTALTSTAQRTQNPLTSATVTAAAPIFAAPDAARQPLRVAAAGTILKVLKEEGDWVQVQFADPQWGPRTGWIEAKSIRISRPDLQPMDLSVPVAGRAPRLPAAQETVQRDPVADGSQQRTFPEPSFDVPTAKLKHAREGFWFNGGLGFGSLGCDYCDGERANGLSGGLSLGGTINDRVLLGVGTTGWARSGTGLTVGTLDARLRFYPSATSGFFVTGGVGLGTITLDGVTEKGVGVVLGLGMDIRVASNLSITPFWNGFAMKSSFDNANVGQLGLSITIH
jgi:hypothetical protein